MSAEGVSARLAEAHSGAELVEGGDEDGTKEAARPKADRLYPLLQPARQQRLERESGGLVGHPGRRRPLPRPPLLPSSFSKKHYSIFLFFDLYSVTFSSPPPPPPPLVLFSSMISLQSSS
eukprot:scaffold80353_cov33-Tisochrysis_lutea.AAC.3